MACGTSTDIFASSVGPFARCTSAAVGAGSTPGVTVTSTASNSASIASCFSTHSPGGVESPLHSRLHSPSVTSLSGLSRLNSPPLSRLMTHRQSVQHADRVYDTKVQCTVQHGGRLYDTQVQCTTFWDCMTCTSAMVIYSSDTKAQCTTCDTQLDDS